MPKESKVFQHLRELSRIVWIAGPKEWPTLSLKTVEKSKKQYARLFRAIGLDGQKTEAAVFQEIVTEHEGILRDGGTATGQNGLIKAATHYRKVKSSLKRRLLNTIFVLNLEYAGYSKYSQMLFNVNRKVFLARVLYSLGATSLAVSEAKGALAQAMQIEEWSCAMGFLAILRAEVAMRGDAKAHRVYLAQYEFCQALLAAEQKADVCVEELQIAFAKSGGEHPSHAEEAEKSAAIVNGLLELHPSFKLSFVSIRLRSLATQIRMDYHATEALCEEAFGLLDRYPQFRNRARTAEYALMGLVSAVQMRDRSKSERWLEQCEQTITPKEENWFVAKEYHYLHLTHSLAFHEAGEVVKEVRANSRYELQTEATHSKWEFFRACAEFANGERVPISIPEDFSALVPSFTADKAGLNTEMVILYLLLLAERKQFSEFRDRLDFVRGYRKRHLKSPEHSQVNRFFRMLELIETCDLRYGKIVHKTEVLLKELKESEQTESLQGKQILPFTWVWERLMERLKEYHPIKYRADE